MPVIPEMDEFVNWDNAGPAISTSAGPDLLSLQPNGALDLCNTDLDLVLENVEGDDFSFWALEHFDSHNPSALLADPILSDLAESQAQDIGVEPYLETPEAPCAHCQRRHFQCKKINEGKFRGYCTSCVALRCECSFGLASKDSPSATFPANPWPTLGDHPGAIPQETGIHPELLHSTSAPDLMALTSTAGSEMTNLKAAGPKVGARFSRESVRILKNWLSTHTRHPYPTEEEKEMLQKQTGLNKTQITNWLANARRRGKITAPRSTSPGVRSFSNAIDIPQRRATPSLEYMKPLDRWKNSPPEHEPASVTDIARAIASSSTTLSSGLDSPYSLNFTDDGSNRSLWAGSTGSSAPTSQSSGLSFASVFSQGSRSTGSFGSMSLNGRGRRRRRRTAPKRPKEKSTLVAPLKAFQCTFCTETFRTKHDWQRHEKSLHLSLERWVCAPDGPRALNPDTNHVCCVFCGEANPDSAHVESHNHSACQERSLEERTFYRKDHLRQHLKLVHNAKFTNWSMEPWKVATPEIRSKCGFCGIVMDTWTIRVDHLAEHFKTGNTMADWKGDWGFDEPVLEMVENSIPPYLIHDERNSPMPYEATQGPLESPRSAYELIKGELLHYISNFKEGGGKMPTDDQLQVEACRIIFGAEVLSKTISSKPSWLRDLLASSTQLARQAQLAPIRRQNESQVGHLQIIGKDNIFQEDPMEKQLHQYVKSRRLLGLTAMDSELQAECCNILSRVEELSSNPSDEVANFLLRLIFGSSSWLAAFRQRASLPRSEDVADERLRSKDPTTIDSTIHSYSRLETELAEYVQTKRLTGIEPDDADLQRQARIIIYEYDDGWNQTAADNAEWLAAFKQRHLSSSCATVDNSPLTVDAGLCSLLHHRPSSTTTTPITPGFTASGGKNTSFGSSSTGSPSGVPHPQEARKLSPYFADANWLGGLARALARYVKSTMSPNNPNCHVPSDEELQHQARWIEYDSDDNWNQTAADNAEWLRRFKKEVGILTDSPLPGLPELSQWNMPVSQGSSGFASPFPSSKTNAVGALDTNTSPNNAQLDSLTGSNYLRSVILAPPTTVFCSQELENGLSTFVAGSLGFPSDEAIRQKAREISGTETTAADDRVLLEKFKTMMRDKLGLGTGSGSGSMSSQQVSSMSSLEDLSTLPVDMDLGLSDCQLGDMLQDMDFEFGDVGGLGLGDGGLGTGFGGV